MSRLGLLLPLLAVAPSRDGAPAAAHDTHVSHARMVIEERAVAIRIRLFHDDLERALRRFAGDSTLRLTAAIRADSLFGAYLSTRVQFEVDGRSVAFAVTASGLERDEAAQPIVWYLLEAGLERPAHRVVLFDGLLFEIFRDQQNIVQLLRLPEDRQQTLYFTAREPRPQTLAP